MGYQEDFIAKIAPIVQELAPKYNIKCCSAIIAQACKESGFGKGKSISGLCKADYHNYFGLKYRKGRVTCNSGTFTDKSTEQRSGGNYVQIQDTWYAFADMAHGVEGYLQFINTSNYANVKGVTDPKTYLTNLCVVDKYCTSQSYVTSCLNDYIAKYNLTQYDTVATKAPKYYKIQLGAFSKKENAEAQLAKVKAKGYNAIIKEVDGLYKIQLGAYSQENNALYAATKLRQAGFSVAIIYS